MTQELSVFKHQETNSPDYVIIIRQPLFSKARPRLTRSGHAYMPAAYKAAQLAMIEQINSQWYPRNALEGPISLNIMVKGEGRGDLDNIAGAFMDAAQGIVFTDDRVGVISKLSIQWAKCPKKDSEWVVEISRYNG